MATRTAKVEAAIKTVHQNLDVIKAARGDALNIAQQVRDVSSCAPSTENVISSCTSNSCVQRCDKGGNCNMTCKARDRCVQVLNNNNYNNGLYFHHNISYVTTVMNTVIHNKINKLIIQS